MNEGRIDAGATFGGPVDLHPLKRLCAARAPEEIAERLVDAVVELLPAAYAGLVVVGPDGTALMGPVRAADAALGPSFGALLDQLVPMITVLAVRRRSEVCPLVSGPTAIQILRLHGGVVGALLAYRDDQRFDPHDLHLLASLCSITELVLDRFRRESAVDEEHAFATRLRNPIGYLRTHLRLAREEFGTRAASDETLRQAFGSLDYAFEAARRLEAMVVSHTRASQVRGG